MDYNVSAAVCVAIMLLLLLIGVPIAWALLSSSIIVGIIFFGVSALDKLGGQTFYFLYSLAWTPLPLFVLLGCLIAETTIGSDLFKAARNWLSCGRKRQVLNDHQILEVCLLWRLDIPVGPRLRKQG